MSRCTTLTRQSALLEFLRCSHLASRASFHRPVFHNKPFRPIQCFPLPLNFVPLRGNLASLRRRSSSFSAHLPDRQSFFPGKKAARCESLAQNTRPSRPDRGDSRPGSCARIPVWGTIASVLLVSVLLPSNMLSFLPVTHLFSELILQSLLFLELSLARLTHGFKMISIRRDAASDLLQRSELDAEGAGGLSHVVAEIRGIH